MPSAFPSKKSEQTQFQNGYQANRPMRQVVELQDLVFNAAKEEGPKGKALASLTRAWCDLEERRRVLTGKPLPGSYRPEKPKKAAAAAGFAALKAKPTPPQTPQV